MNDNYLTLFVGHTLLRKFDPCSMDFLKWLNSFEYMAEVVKVQPSNRTNFLLNLLLPDVARALYYSMSPLNPPERPYEEIALQLQKLFGKYQGEQAAAYRFEIRDQFPREPVQHYVHALIKLLGKCTNHVNHHAILKKRFIEGLENEGARAILKPQCEFILLDKAIKIAKQIEANNRGVKRPHN